MRSIGSRDVEMRMYAGGIPSEARRTVALKRAGAAPSEAVLDAAFNVLVRPASRG